ncbi:MAG TPA: hypothetical protein VFJ58_09960 [Armatimonadota bacterium]|nr:hypothetical protein [Armatimonadota bacterium]
MNKSKNTLIAGFSLCLAAILLLNLTSRPGNAEPGNGVEQRLAALEQKLIVLQTQNTTLQGQVTTLQTALSQETADRKAGDGATLSAAIGHADAGDAAALSAAEQYASSADSAILSSAQQSINADLGPLQAKTQFISVNGSEMTIAGANLTIVNGLGHTDTTNGLGNLILGYNKLDASAFGPSHTGSHNLVIGDDHQYLSYGGLVAGFDNGISAPYACVSGGTYNFATATGASISGGDGNLGGAPTPP